MPFSAFHSPIVERTITALNQGALDDFLAQFASDAEVVDVSTYKGRQAISAWVQRENFNVQLHLQAEREGNPEGTIIQGHVRSQGGYNGPATLTFTLRNGLVQRLVIE